MLLLPPKEGFPLDLGGQLPSPLLLVSPRAAAHQLNPKPRGARAVGPAGEPQLQQLPARPSWSRFGLRTGTAG